MLKRYFTPAFDAAIKAGAPSVMINPGSLNGVPAHASLDIVQQLLRTELQFKGLVTRYSPYLFDVVIRFALLTANLQFSGPGDVDNLCNLHHVVPSTALVCLTIRS